MGTVAYVSFIAVMRSFQILPEYLIKKWHLDFECCGKIICCCRHSRSSFTRAFIFVWDHFSYVSGTGTYLCVIAALEGKKISVSASKAKLRKLRRVNEVASVANLLILICRLLVSTSVGILNFFRLHRPHWLSAAHPLQSGRSCHHLVCRPFYFRIVFWRLCRGYRYDSNLFR
jgi:hypothetical protein